MIDELGIGLGNVFVGIGGMVCFIAMGYWIYRLTEYYQRLLNNCELEREVKIKLRVGIMRQIAEEENIDLDSIILTEKENIRERIRGSI